MKQNKPLGELGEVTVNEALNKGIEFLRPLIELGKDYNITVDNSLQIFSCFLLYKGVVKLYSKTAFKDNTSNLSVSDLLRSNRYRERRIRNFMLGAAPVILGVFLIGRELTGPMVVNVKVDIESQVPDNKSNQSGKIISSSLFFFTNKKLPD